MISPQILFETPASSRITGNESSSGSIGVPQRHWRDHDGGLAAWFANLACLQVEPRGLTSSQEEQIRQRIVEKNMLFFHRWRPQNITYLTGFRKHEQGNNAVEIAQFDPLVEQIEVKIDELKKP